MGDGGLCLGACALAHNEIEKRNKQIDELIKKAGIQNSNITTNIQNNIKLLAYKDTDLSKISDKYWEHPANKNAK